MFKQRSIRKHGPKRTRNPDSSSQPIAVCGRPSVQAPSNTFGGVAATDASSSTAAADRLERLLKRKFGESDAQQQRAQRAEPRVSRKEAVAPRADTRPASAMPALHTATQQQKPVAPQHQQQPVAHPVVQQQPSAVQWHMPQAFFGYALRKPFNDASIYYKSVFYSGHVFRFDLVAEYVGDGVVNRCYCCSDCFQMCLMPQFSCFATQTIITVNDRIVHRDPDAPQGIPHMCVRVPKGTFPVHTMPDTHVSPPPTQQPTISAAPAWPQPSTSSRPDGP
ncbi:hypothetical protein AAVH_08342 [Aphelenchoides avenae]|nr:hypothetical protein AAVH_08342 [Aphelenchus avenae]